MSQPSVSRLHVAGGSHGPLPRPCRPSANSRTFSCWQQAGLQAHKPRQRQLWRHRQGPSCSREPRQELTACSRSQPGSHGNSATCKTWCIDIVSSHVSLGFNRSSSRAHGRTAVHLVRSSRSSSDNTGHTGPGSQPKDAAEFQEASPSSASDVSNSSSSSGSSSSPQGAGGPEAAGASSPPGGTSHDGSGAGGGGSTGGRGPGPGSGDNPAAKMPKWFQAWVWVTVVVYLVWRWRWRRERAAERELRLREAAAAEVAEAEWEQFSQRYRGRQRRQDE